MEECDLMTIVNLQTVLAACSRCGRQTWALSPSGGDEKQAVYGSFPLEQEQEAKEKQFALIQFHSGEGLL